MKKIIKVRGGPFILRCLLIFTAVMPLYADPISDRLEVYDKDSNVKYSVSVLESEEVSGQVYAIGVPNLADPSKFGSYSLVIDASTGKISDVFGVANSPDGNFYLAFISYTEPVPAVDWPPAGPVYIENTGGPFDATTYLHSDLLAQGYTAAFYSDPAGEIPEPAPMLLLGSGLLGLAVYGRKKVFKE